MYHNFHSPTYGPYNLISSTLSSLRLFLSIIYFLSNLYVNSRNSARYLLQSFLSRQILFRLLFSLLLIISYSSQALTSKTLNIIHGNAPYLTFDGGVTQATNVDSLLGITLSNGDEITPENNSSSLANPIVLPNVGESFADIGMSVPIDTNEIDLMQLIGPPYNYWNDDDGDGQGANGVTVTGNLSLAISDKNNQPVMRSEILDICNAPYKVTLMNTNGTLRTRYGIPNVSSFNASNETYYINPKAKPVVCFAKPNLQFGSLRSDGHDFRGPATMWNETKGFIPQSTNASSYDLNFPTTGAHGLFFDLDIGGSGPLNWEPVSPNGNIKAIMTPNASGTSVRVVLQGPTATEAQWRSLNPSSLGEIERPTLPQTFELVGRDSHGNDVVKYGFVLKLWFVPIGTVYYDYVTTKSWCTNIKYHLPKLKDLTNATCQNLGSGSHCQGAAGATPLSPNNYYQRIIGAGLFSEWGNMHDHYRANFNFGSFWTTDELRPGLPLAAGSYDGFIRAVGSSTDGACVYP